jgi:hypothetical protein
MERAIRKPRRQRGVKGWDLWEAMAGKGHSVHTDVSSNKYKHLAEAYADPPSAK